MQKTTRTDPSRIVDKIRRWGHDLGFCDIRISDTDLSEAEQAYNTWLRKGFHGDMDYMVRHGSKRTRPAELEPGTISIISARMDYYPGNSRDAWEVLGDSALGYVSRYALGRDYHKLMRKRLQQLTQKIETAIGAFGYRVFVDSAPVLEKPIAAKAGIGWTGKHSNILARDGSWFFLGEIYTTLPLPADPPVADHCGRCTACIDICPTRAIVEPGVVDARLCISYLTIENHGAIPTELRPLLGNRIYGCDDCQLICPWNKFARHAAIPDFDVRNGLDAATLVELFQWTEEEFLHRLEGSAIRRIGHLSWLRNIAVALGNGDPTPDAIAALEKQRHHPDPMVAEHVAWAIAQLSNQDGPPTQPLHVTSTY